MNTPTEIKLNKRERRLELIYGDGDTLSLSAEYLRVSSPSAEVRGHGPGQEVLQHGKKQVAIERLEPAGHYALLIHFDDGHNTGIYSWDYLRELGQHHDEYWRDYLKRLDAAGLSRDPEERALKFFEPD